MSRRRYDPLATIPSAAAVAAKIAETRRLLRRLRILHRLARRLEGRSPAAKGVGDGR